MKNILFIHQSAELYGSDKTLLVLVVAFQRKGFNPIVVLPEAGPLLESLMSQNIQTFVLPVLKLSRKMFTIKGIISFPFQIVSSIQQLHRVLNGLRIDVVYSNTLAVLLGFFYAKQKKIKHIWHVHEIITKPKLVKNIFSRLITAKSNNKIIYNSFATQNFWEGKGLKVSSEVVWNGLKKPEDTQWSQDEVISFRKDTLNVHPDDIVIGLVGRINKWKGQILLLDAFSELAFLYPNIKLVYVGSCPPMQEEYLEILKYKIDKFKLNNRVLILPFQSNIWNIWQSIDIAVIPSIEPEPFGLVAIEAMLSRKPIVASAHGGLVEIIANGVTGILFEPNNQIQLSSALNNLIADKQMRIDYGNAGYDRAITNFTVDQYVQKIETICKSI